MTSAFLLISDKQIFAATFSATSDSSTTNVASMRVVLDRAKFRNG